MSTQALSLGSCWPLGLVCQFAFNHPEGQFVNLNITTYANIQAISLKKIYSEQSFVHLGELDSKFNFFFLVEMIM